MNTSVDSIFLSTNTQFVPETCPSIISIGWPHALPSHKRLKTSGILWVVPPTQDASDHQDYEPYSKDRTL